MGTIKHSKVSGVANSGSEVGGGDWDAAHVETGFRFVGYAHIKDSNAPTDISVVSAIGVSITPANFTKTTTGIYNMNLADVSLPQNNTFITVDLMFNQDAPSRELMMCSQKVVNGGGASNGYVQVWVSRLSAGSVVSANYTEFKIMFYRND